MAGKITSTAIVNLVATEDSTNNSPINRGASVSYDGDFSYFQAYQLCNAVFPGASITPPSTPFNFYQFYIKNLGSTGSIQVIYATPGGGNVTIILGPGDFFMFWSKTITAPAIGGQSQGGTGVITVTSSSGLVPFEYFIGG